MTQPTPVVVRESKVTPMDLLTLLLIHHKLAGTFDYAWWLVFWPQWGPAAAFILVGAGAWVIGRVLK